jgi:hypothetical protein
MMNLRDRGLREKGKKLTKKQDTENQDCVKDKWPNTPPTDLRRGTSVRAGGRGA